MIFRVTTPGNLHVDKNTLGRAEDVVLIPSREALAMYPGFVKAYENRELSFDETYRDLCVALSGTPLRGPRLEAVKKLADPLQQILGGPVVLQGDRFYLASADGNLEAHLLSEGFRKIGSLYHLIVNGSLMRNGFLLWDEPEANLNPKIVTQMVAALQRLASFGLQVFIASHDYLLTSELSIAAEYPDSIDKSRRCETRFFCLSRAQGGGIDVAQGRTLPELAQNPILDEFAAHYDRENAAFVRSRPPVQHPA